VRIGPVAAMSLGVIMFSGCASGTLFHDDFDADAAGGPPNSSPAGPPTGDLIYIADSSNPQQLVVVNSSALNSRALQYSNVNLPPPNRFVGFMSKEEALPANQKFRAIWVGRIDLTSSGSALDIWLGDSHFKAIAALRFDNGEVFVRTSSNPEAYESIGTYSESANETVIISVNKGTQQYSAIVGGDASGWRPVLDASALTTDRPTLYFWFSEPVSSSAKYVVDNVAIEKIK
jgi:hypothetical protein